MVEVPKDFDAMFRSLVVPDLRKRCRFMGSQVALDLVGFYEAIYVVWEEARRRGALRLPVELCEQLEDWIATTILNSEAEYRPCVIAYRTVVDRVAADIARTESEWHEIWSAEGG